MAPYPMAPPELEELRKKTQRTPRCRLYPPLEIRLWRPDTISMREVWIATNMHRLWGIKQGSSEE